MLTLYYAVNDNHVYMHVHVHVLRRIMGCQWTSYYSKQLGRTIRTCHPGHNWLCRLGGEEREGGGREGGEYTSTSSLPCNLLFITFNFGALVVTVWKLWLCKSVPHTPKYHIILLTRQLVFCRSNFLAWHLTNPPPPLQPPFSYMYVYIGISLLCMYVEYGYTNM